MNTSKGQIWPFPAALKTVTAIQKALSTGARRRLRFVSDMANQALCIFDTCNAGLVSLKNEVELPGVSA